MVGINITSRWYLDIYCSKYISMIPWLPSSGKKTKVTRESQKLVLSATGYQDLAPHSDCKFPKSTATHLLKLSAQTIITSSHVLFDAHINPHGTLQSLFVSFMYIPICLHCITCIYCGFILLLFPSPTFTLTPWILRFVTTQKWSWFPFLVRRLGLLNSENVNNHYGNAFIKTGGQHCCMAVSSN